MVLCSIVGIAFTRGLWEFLDFDYVKESAFHTRRSGHTEFHDRTAEVAEEEGRRTRAELRQRLVAALDLLNEVRNPNMSKNFDFAKNMSTKADLRF